jgi:hypothetical protein
MKQKVTKKLINQLCDLQKQFSLYFKNFDVSESDRVRNPFAANNVSGLTTCEQQQLIDKSCDGSLKSMCDADELPQFWLLVKNDYPSLSEKAMKFLLPIATTSSCET